MVSLQKLIVSVIPYKQSISLFSSSYADIFHFYDHLTILMWKQFFHKNNIRLRWLFAILLPVYILAFFLVLEPLKGEIVAYAYQWEEIVRIYFAYLIIMFFFCILLPFWMPKFFSAKNFSLVRFFSWFFSVVLTGAIVSYYFDSQYQDTGNTTNWTVLYFKTYMLPVCVFLATIILPFFLMYNPKSKTEKVEQNDTATLIPESYTIMPKDIVKEQPSAVCATPILKFTDANGKNMLEIPLGNLYYITSANNYIEVFYQKEDSTQQNISESFTPTRLLLRNTLKIVEEQNIHIPELYRCHKAYIVNKQKVVKVKGNAKGHALVLKDIDLEIPVSRNKNAEIEHLLPTNM